MPALLATVGSMMTNPAMKAMVRVQQERQIQADYSRLFKFLSLPLETEDAVKRLLMEQQMALLEPALSLANQDESSPEHQKAIEDLEKLKESYDQEIAALLGEDAYDVFRQYQESAGTRELVENYTASMSAASKPLTDQQEYDLVNAIQQELDLLEAKAQAGNAPSFDAQLAQYVASASAILTPAQLADFKKFMAGQQEMEAVAEKLAEQMLGNGLEK